MDTAILWLAASVVGTGIWSGLLTQTTMILHPMMQAQDGPTFARQMEMLLREARKAPATYVCVGGLVVAPAGALATIYAAGDRSTAFFLTAVGLGATIVGAVLVSYFLALPNYERILAWDPEHMPEGWEAVRSRYFALNWTRAALAWAAFGLLIAGLVRRA